MALSKGFGLDRIDMIQNEGVAHQKLVESIEKETGNNLICYISNFPHPLGILMDEDDSIIETMLKSINLDKYDGNIDLIIHTRGGSPLAAQKIVRTCRTYSNKFRVIIAKTAMSAGTIIAMGADKIVMRETAELGPIDPQMIINTPNGQTQRPASAWVEAYLALIEKTQEAIKKNEPPQPFLQQLSQMDPSWIQICLKARKLSTAIAEEFLGRYMLKGKSKDEITLIVEKFLEVGEKLSHGMTIRGPEAINFGLEIEIIDKNTMLDKLIWELLERTERYVQSKGFAKYVIARNGGLNVAIQTLKMLL
jgi:ATP-dependent protease ClpP protease subunit